MSGYDFAGKQEADVPVIISRPKSRNERVLGLGWRRRLCDQALRPREAGCARAVAPPAQAARRSRGAARRRTHPRPRRRTVAVQDRRVDLTPSSSTCWPPSCPRPARIRRRSARPFAGRRLRRLRAHHRRAHSQPAHQDRSRPKPAPLYRDGFRRQLSTLPSIADWKRPLMRSVALKLTLAFLAVGVMANLSRRLREHPHAARFDRFIFDNSQQPAIAAPSDYYRSHGGWMTPTALLNAAERWLRPGSPRCR